MPDREKVIKAIDICLGHGKCDDCGYRIKGGYSTMDCRKPMMRDALSLLKEQPEIVRCENCKYCNNKDYVCEHPNEWGNEDTRNQRNLEWFCADGERKDDLK